MPFSSPSSPSPLKRIESSTPHYQPFPTDPPSSSGRPRDSLDQRDRSPHAAAGKGKDGRSSPSPSRLSASSHHKRPRSRQKDETPLPVRQLTVLAIIALAEQTALNSIAPYLPDMVTTFPEVDQNLVGTYVGLVASSFALAQFATNFFWGWLSDRVGRKPVILTGTLLTAACFVGFGFSRTLLQAMTAQALMGLVNGNQGVVSTCLGELTDRSNQSRAFTYLPIVYGIGGITGPILGGLLVNKGEKGKTSARHMAGREIGEGMQKGMQGYPYLPPNLMSAGVLMLDLLVTIFFLEESLEGMRAMPPLSIRVNSLWIWLWQFTGLSRRPRHMLQKNSFSSPSHSHPRGSNHSSSRPATREQTTLQHEPGPTNVEEDALSISSLLSSQSDADSEPLLSRSKQVEADTHDISTSSLLTPSITLILATFFIFQLANIGYNSLFPIFAQAPPPLGRDLSPEEIGISLAFAGIVTIVFQVGVFGKLKDRMGNCTTYRVGLAGFVMSFLAMPWVGFRAAKEGMGGGNGTVSSRAWLYFELAVVLIVKTVAAVGGLTSALLLVSCSSHHLLTS